MKKKQTDKAKQRAVKLKQNAQVSKKPTAKRSKKTAQDKGENAPQAVGGEPLIYGIHSAEECLQNAKVDIIKIYLQKGFTYQKHPALARYLSQQGAPINEVPKAKLDQLTNRGNHQGIVLQLAAYPYSKLEDCFAKAEAMGGEPFFLMLDGTEDPHNLGSMLRTADAAGVHGVIIQERRAVGLTATVAKISSGALEHVPVVRVTNLSQTIDQLKTRGLWAFGLDMAGESLWEAQADMPILLVIGNEHKGLSPGLRKHLDGILSIPMQGQVESLNASVAAALAMYEIYRKRQ